MGLRTPEQGPGGAAKPGDLPAAQAHQHPAGFVFHQPAGAAPRRLGPVADIAVAVGLLAADEFQGVQFGLRPFAASLPTSASISLSKAALISASPGSEPQPASSAAAPEAVMAR